MDSAALRAAQRPLKAAYREQPQEARPAEMTVSAGHASLAGS
jgi:hypothetical protein